MSAEGQLEVAHRWPLTPLFQCTGGDLCLRDRLLLTWPISLTLLFDNVPYSFLNQSPNLQHGHFLPCRHPNGLGPARWSDRASSPNLALTSASSGIDSSVFIRAR